MSGKNQFPSILNWQSTNPAINFLPTPNQYGSTPSGVVAGVMTGTTTIYSNIIDLSRMDNAGLEVTWTGTPTGTISVWLSNSGKYFYEVTDYDSPLGQPAGSAGGYGVNLNQWPWKYFYMQYVNSSGSGDLYVYCQFKDLN